VAIGFTLLALGWLYYAIEIIRAPRPDVGWQLRTLADVWYLASPIAFAFTAAAWWWLMKTVEGLGESRATSIGYLLLSVQGVVLGVGGLAGAWTAYENPYLDILFRASCLEVVGGAMVGSGYLNLAMGTAKGRSRQISIGDREPEAVPAALAMKRTLARRLILAVVGLGTVAIGVLLVDLVDWTTHSAPSPGREGLWALGFVLVAVGAFGTLAGLIKGLRPRA
jgi:hypothetical protein